MSKVLKSIKTFWINALKTKEEKHKEFIQKEFNEGKILNIGENKK